MILVYMGKKSKYILCDKRKYKCVNLDKDAKSISIMKNVIGLCTNLSKWLNVETVFPFKKCKSRICNFTHIYPFEYDNEIVDSNTHIYCLKGKGVYTILWLKYMIPYLSRLRGPASLVLKLLGFFENTFHGTQTPWWTAWNRLVFQDISIVIIRGK